MATPPIRTATEITTILNKGNHTLADLGYSLIGDAKRGQDLTETDFRDKVYRLILLYTYLGEILDPDTGSPKLYWSATANKVAFNKLLDAVVALSDPYTTASTIPLILSRGATIIYYPSSSGPSGGGQSQSGGPANPGGVTFQNVNVSSPGEVVDRINAAENDYAFYIIRIAGSGVGEGNRLDMVGVNWKSSGTPVLTIYRGNGAGGTVPNTVTYSAAIVDGFMELTAVVPTDGWNVKGTRISFENISFQNAQGPLPTGGTEGQYLRKSSGVDFDAAFAAIAMSEVTGLATALANRLLLAGGTMTGAIAMGSNKITGLADATADDEAVNRGQLGGRVFKEITSGPWDMDADSTIDAVHGLSATESETIIYHGTTLLGGAVIPITSLEITNSGGSVVGGFAGINTTRVLLIRTTGSTFDNANFTNITAKTLISYVPD